MKHQITEEQIQYYQNNGYIVIEDFLSTEELEHWRKSVTTAVKERAGIKIRVPGHWAWVGSLFACCAVAMQEISIEKKNESFHLIQYSIVA